MWLAIPSTFRAAVAATVLSVAALAMPAGVSSPLGSGLAFADEEPPPPPPLPEDDEAGVPDEDAPPVDDAGGPPPGNASDLTPIRPGEAVVTRFSHTLGEPDSEGQPVTVIDLDGISASIIDIRRPAEPPEGQHWIDEPQRAAVTAGEVGQVFGVTLAPVEGRKTPDIFLSATAAYGLHRRGKAPGKTEWMPGMWGPDGGPGSIYRMGEGTDFLAEKFTDVTLDGRENTGAALGNIAHDKWHRRLFVSDLETGMIHSLGELTGEDFGHFDHGAMGRADFLDATTGRRMSLPPVAFDPSTAANIENCASDFSTTPDCWNIADFRRRVWGLDVQRSANGEVRLYYSVWGSDAFGNPDWASAGDDRRNSVWSVAIKPDGLFDESSVRREFFLPAFWPALPALGDKAGNSNAVSDIAFPGCEPADTMLLAERGGMRNLGLDAPEAFATPYESRVLRYERAGGGTWRPQGRYDVGFHQPRAGDNAPQIFAGAAGGAAFGYGLTEDGIIDTGKPSQSVWMTGDGLCSPAGPCTGVSTGEHDDDAQVHGLQGTPADAYGPIEPGGTANAAALDRSLMVDTDINIANDGSVIPGERMRDDATRIGDVAIYQICETGAPPPPLPDNDVPDEVLPPTEPPGDWPVHTLNMSHEKWNSSGHQVQRLWHRRDGSWHAVERSWHWRNQSYHSRNQSWHWRGGSWHSKAISWHRKGQSSHDKRYSWHGRDRLWHLKGRSYHDRARSWGGTHSKGKSYHVKGRTWSGEHSKGRSYHVKGRTWSGEHNKGKSYHVRDRSWSGDHVRGRSYHDKGKTWGGDRPDHVKGRSYHNKGKTWGGDRPDHVKGRSYHEKGKTWGGDKPDHVKGRSYHDKGKTWGDDDRPKHSKAKSDADKKPVHGKAKSDAEDRPKHSKQRSAADDKPKHAKQKSDSDRKPKHAKEKSNADKKPKHGKQKSNADKKPQHDKEKSDAQKKLIHKKKTSEFVEPR